MVDDMALAAAEDDEDCEPIHKNFECTAIASLFDFNEGHWVQLHTRSTMTSFDEELALYKVLDLDAEGEDDPDISVDDSTVDILFN